MEVEVEDTEHEGGDKGVDVGKVVDLDRWEEKDSPRNFVVSELSKTEVVFIDTTKPDGGFLRYDTSKKDTLEFSDHEPDGTVHFSLLFKKVGASS